MLNELNAEVTAAVLIAHFRHGILTYPKLFVFHVDKILAKKPRVPDKKNVSQKCKDNKFKSTETVYVSLS